MQAIHATRPGGHVGYVGVPSDVAGDGRTRDQDAADGLSPPVAPPADRPDPSADGGHPNPRAVDSGVLDALGHHTVGLTGFEPATP